MKKEIGTLNFFKLHLLVIVVFSLMTISACGGGGGGGGEEDGGGGEVGSLEDCLAGCTYGDAGDQQTCRFQCYAIWGSPDDGDDDSDGDDETPPTIPTNFTAEAVSYNQINLSWDQSTDNESGSLRYDVYKNGEKYFVDVSKTEVSDMPTVRSSTNTCYAVRSCDSSNNCSDPSPEVCATTPENPYFKWNYNAGVYLSNLIVSPDGTIYAGLEISSSNGTLYSINANGTLNWTYSDVNPNDFGLVGNDGTVYTRSSNDETLLAIKNDGTLKWSYSTGDIFSSPYLAKGNDDIVYVGSGDTLLAINDDGSLRWSTQEFNNPDVKVVGNGGTVYVEHSENLTFLSAVNDNGTLEWSYITGYLDTVLIGTDGTIYALKISPYPLIALNANGTLKWSFELPMDDIYNLVLGSDDTAYLRGERDYTLYAINTDGTLNWSYFIGYSSNNPSPLIGNDGTVYVGSNDTLLAISEDGTLLWDYTTEGIQALDYYISNPYSVWALEGFVSEMSPGLIDSFGTIYVGFAGTLLAINPDGTLNWSFTTESYLISSPAIDSDGTVYIGSYDNNLYALQE